MMDEDRNVPRQLKTCKAAEHDNITAEMMKVFGAEKVTKLLHAIYQTGEI